MGAPMVSESNLQRPNSGSLSLRLFAILQLLENLDLNDEVEHCFFSQTFRFKLLISFLFLN